MYITVNPLPLLLTYKSQWRRMSPKFWLCIWLVTYDVFLNWNNSSQNQESVSKKLARRICWGYSVLLLKECYKKKYFFCSDRRRKSWTHQLFIGLLVSLLLLGKLPSAYTSTYLLWVANKFWQCFVKFFTFFRKVLHSFIIQCCGSGMIIPAQGSRIRLFPSQCPKL